MVSMNAQLEFPWYDRGSGVTCAVALTWKSADLYLGSEMDATHPRSGLPRQYVRCRVTA